MYRYTSTNWDYYGLFTFLQLITAGYNRVLVSSSCLVKGLKPSNWTLCLKALCDPSHSFCSPFAYVDPLHCNMAYLYLELLKDSLNEYAYAAELAGLNYDLQNTIYGMYVSIQSTTPHTHPPPAPVLIALLSLRSPCLSQSWVNGSHWVFVTQ